MSSRDLRGFVLIRVTMLDALTARDAVSGMARIGLLPPLWVVAKWSFSNIIDESSLKVSVITVYLSRPVQTYPAARSTAMDQLSS